MTDSATAPEAARDGGTSDGTAPDGATTAAFADRVFGSVLGAIELLSIHLGDRLGWYRALDEAGPLSSAELAARTGTVERYAREWLEQQAVNGILAVDEADAAAPASERRFALPPAHAGVLTDTASLDYMAPIARMITAAAMRADSLVEAYRGGGGVSWAQFGDHAHESQADVNRPWFERRLGDALASVAELDAVLSRPGAPSAAVGCGHGWSTLALARAYPSARVVGIDVDEPSIAAARENAEAAGLVDRVEFRLAGGEELAEPGAFDAGFVFEALHDMPRPVEVLDAMRRAVRGDGAVVIMDEAVAPAFAPDGDEVERLMYGYSILMCLPDSLATPGSVGTGTVMRQATLERYATEAGFSRIEELPIEDFAMFRFTRLVH